jgi:hypothetical protein
MKNIISVVVLLLCLKASGQNAKEEFDGKKWVAPYVLDTLKGWDVELPVYCILPSYRMQVLRTSGLQAGAR